MFSVPLSAPLAQSVEHQTFNLRVVGSSPTGGSLSKKHTAKHYILIDEITTCFLFPLYFAPVTQLVRVPCL